MCSMRENCVIYFIHSVHHFRTAVSVLLGFTAAFANSTKLNALRILARLKTQSANRNRRAMSLMELADILSANAHLDILVATVRLTSMNALQNLAIMVSKCTFRLCRL